ncbi:MAG: MoaD/ThiS family protein [Solirubrobacteraceae bacterium]
MKVRIRLGSAIARLAPAPTLSIELPDGATVEDLYERLGAAHPEIAPALGSALALVEGAHVRRGQPLSNGDEVALLTPVSGG